MDIYEVKLPEEIEERNRQRKEWEKRIIENYLRKCPPLYQNTDIKKLPHPDVSNLCLSKWTTGKSMYLIGPTRTGKTRTAWLMVKDFATRTGRHFEHFDGLAWATSVSRAFGNPDETERWLDRVSKVDLLFLDDLFKSKTTEAQEFAIYGILERRTAHFKPTIITSNLSGHEVIDRSVEGAGRVMPIIERLREFFMIVNFGDPKNA